jgi:hypothetical protein
MANCDPGLKPNHPNHKINTLRHLTLNCVQVLHLPSVLYFPILGPTKAAATNDAQPPTECTTLEPANQ